MMDTDMDTPEVEIIMVSSPRNAEGHSFVNLHVKETFDLTDYVFLAHYVDLGGDKHEMWVYKDDYEYHRSKLNTLPGNSTGTA